MALDEKTGEMLKLKLDRVHRERLSRVGENTYFACADFITPDGKVYDLDVFMEGTDKDNMKFSKFTIHKEAGKERYTWYEEGGLWKQKLVAEAAEEHPKEKEKEHPEEKEKEPPKEHPEEKMEEQPEHPEEKTEEQPEHPVEKTEEQPEHPAEKEKEPPKVKTTEHPEHPE